MTIRRKTDGDGKACGRTGCLSACDTNNQIKKADGGHLQSQPPHPPFSSSCIQLFRTQRSEDPASSASSHGFIQSLCKALSWLMVSLIPAHLSILRRNKEKKPHTLYGDLSDLHHHSVGLRDQTIGRHAGIKMYFRFFFFVFIFAFGNLFLIYLT